MDQIKIGKFISEMRKAQGLTQKELADQLELSDKTISKWECGNGIPDPSIMVKLCDILNMNVNELLSGERLSLSDYNQKAEENMMNLIHETKESKKSSRRNIVFGILGEIFLLLIVGYTIIMWGGINNTFIDFIDLPSIIIMGAFVVVMLLSTKMGKSFFKALHYFVKSDKIISVKELQQALLSVKLVMITVILSGVINSTLSFIIIFHTFVEDLASIGIFVSAACIGVFYSSLVSLLLLPVAAKLKKALITS